MNVKQISDLTGHSKSMVYVAACRIFGGSANLPRFLSFDDEVTQLIIDDLPEPFEFDNDDCGLFD